MNTKPEIEPFEQKVSVERGYAVWRPQFIGKMLSIRPIPREIRVGAILQGADVEPTPFQPGVNVTIIGADGEYTIRGKRVK